MDDDTSSRRHHPTTTTTGKIRSYIPPHLRDQSLITKRTSSSSSSSSYNPGSELGNPKSGAPVSYIAPHRRDQSLITTRTSSYSSSSYKPSSKLGNPKSGAPIRTVISSPAQHARSWKSSASVNYMSEQEIKDTRSRLGLEVYVDDGSPSAPPPIQSFEEMDLPKIMLQNILALYEVPTPIQSQVIPIVQRGRDVLAFHDVGSCAAYTIPMVQRCLDGWVKTSMNRVVGAQALVLAPTSKHAQEIEKEVQYFSKYVNNFTTAILMAGGDIEMERKKLLAGGIDVLVATPESLLYHIKEIRTNFISETSYFVLDEADMLINNYDLREIREVMWNIHQKPQTLLFSTTMSEEVKKFALEECLFKPVEVLKASHSYPYECLQQTVRPFTNTEKVVSLVSPDMSSMKYLTINPVEARNEGDVGCVISRPLDEVLQDLTIWENGDLSFQCRMIIRKIVEFVGNLELSRNYFEFGVKDIMITDELEVTINPTKIAYKFTAVKVLRCRVSFQLVMMDMFKENEINVELHDFVSKIRSLEGSSFKQLLSHPFLHSLEERYMFPIHFVWYIRHHICMDQWERKYRRMHPSVVVWPEEIVIEKSNIVKIITLSGQRDEYKESPKDALTALKFTRNLLVHLHEAFKGKPQPSEENIHIEVLRKLREYFPKVWIQLYDFLLANGINPDYNSCLEEEEDRRRVWERTADQGYEIVLRRNKGGGRGGRW